MHCTMGHNPEVGCRGLFCRALTAAGPPGLVRPARDKSCTGPGPCHSRVSVPGHCILDSGSGLLFTLLVRTRDMCHARAVSKKKPQTSVGLSDFGSVNQNAELQLCYLFFFTFLFKYLKPLHFNC